MIRARDPPDELAALNAPVPRTGVRRLLRQGDRLDRDRYHMRFPCGSGWIGRASPRAAIGAALSRR
jgi:hypothetical protein